MSDWLRRAPLAAWLCWLSWAAVAEPLTLAAAVERTLARSPELAVFAPRLRIEEARVARAALKPPLEARAELQDAFGTGRTRALETAEATFALSQVVELGGQRTARVAAARAGADLVDAERAAAALDVLAEVARRFVRVVADQEQLALARRATALAEQARDATAARVAAARAPEVESRRARVALVRNRIELEHAEHELAASRRKLAALWGESELAFDAAEADLFALPAVGAFEPLLARLEASPDFARFASEARLRDAELRVAEAQARGTIDVTAGLKRLQQSDDEAFVLGVNVPLFGAKRAAPAAAEARAARALTDAERDAQRVRAEAELFAIHQELAHSVAEANELRATVLPEMQAAAEAARYAYERGRYGYLEWTDAQRELIAVERAAIDAAANAHLFCAELERLTGSALPENHDD